MWRGIVKISSQELSAFEQHFNFHFDPVLRTFLLDHNAGISLVSFPTRSRERKLKMLLDFADHTGKAGAWQVNERLQKQLGPSRAAFAVDSQGNILCVEKTERGQRIIVWNHVSDTCEECLLDIPAFLRVIG